jgi:hypothetical protein
MTTQWAGVGARWMAVSALALATSTGCLDEPDEGELELAASVPARVLSGTALFVVADASAVGAGDSAVKRRLEGLGLSVAVKSDGQARASDASGKAVIVLSSSIDSAVLGGIFRDAAVPVVSWEHALHDELGMATDAGTVADQTSIEVVHGAHPAAAGLRDAVTVGVRGPVRWGTPGRGAAIVALAGGGSRRAAHFVYEAGAALTTGAAAPARRVGTFLDHATSQQLTDAGWALFDASLVWATGARAVPAVAPVCALSGQALFVVADASAVGDGDAAVRRRLEDLGLRVTTRSDGQVRARDAGGMRLVVISSSVDSNLLGAMFRDTAVPVVTWEHALYGDLAMASEDGGSDDDQKRIDMMVSSHPLAALLSGDVQVLSSTGTVRWARPVASAVVVARPAGSSRRAAHFAIEAGAALSGNRTAPARRVGTFLDHGSSHRLKPAGWALFDAAVVWAAGGGAPRPVAALITGDHDLEPGDGAIKARLEALGFATRVVRQSSLQHTSLAGVRLVVVTESTQSAEIGSYFAERPIPAVIAEYNLLDDMGMATSRGTASGQREVDIARPGSRLAAGLSGRVRVYRDSMIESWGRPAPSADIAAALPGDGSKATVFGYEAGAAMFGLAAPARRVGLFVFKGDNLTDAGWALFDASVAWAASPAVDNVCGDGRDTGVGACVRTVCDSTGCRPVARTDGARCDDGSYCTVDDSCSAGVCEGTARSCDATVDACTTATCDEAADTCVATPRDDCEITCTTPAALDAYREGWRSGHRRIHRSWRTTDDCDALEGFLDRASVRLEELLAERDAAEPSSDRRCRISGKFDGGLAALESIQLACDDACVMQGALVGAAASAAYCELAIETAGSIEVDEWLRGPVNLCGLSHEITCDGVFIDETSRYVSPAGTCAPYTRAPHVDIWDRSRERSCDYQNRDGG